MSNEKIEGFWIPSFKRMTSLIIPLNPPLKGKVYKSALLCKGGAGWI